MNLSEERKGKKRKEVWWRKRTLGQIARRLLLAASLVMLLAVNVGADAIRPILFVPGNGDSAALWYTTIWRFESNGYDPSLLSAIDFKHPTARSDDTNLKRTGAARPIRPKSSQLRSQKFNLAPGRSR